MQNFTTTEIYQALNRHLQTMNATENYKENVTKIIREFLAELEA